VLEDPVLTGLAEKHGRTPAQVVLRWHIQLGNIVFPKSASPERIRQNIDVFGFALDDADMAEIAKLDEGRRTGPDPATFTG
jgi:2,5-diketo-D-gluconate reductase A